MLGTVRVAERSFLVEDSSDHLHDFHVELSADVLVRLTLRSFEHHVLVSDLELRLNHCPLI